MKLVIDMSDSLYDRLIEMNSDRDTCSFNESALVEIIQNGKPLPKGHGDLKDADNLDERPMIDRVLEIISDVRHDVNNGYMFDMVDEIEKRVKALKGGDME